MVPWPCRPPPAPPVVVVVVPLCGLIGASKGLVVPVFPVVSLSSFHTPTTPQAVAREAGDGWCVVKSLLSSLCIHGGHGGGGPPSRPGPEGVSWGRVGVVVTWRHWSVVSSPLPIVVPPTTHPTSSCLRGWGQVVCHGDIAALVVVCHCPPSLSPHLPLLFVCLLSSVYAPTIHPTSSGSQARGGCWSCWSCCGGGGPGSRGLGGVSDVAGMQGSGGCLPCGYLPRVVSQDPSGPS